MISFVFDVWNGKSSERESMGEWMKGEIVHICVYFMTTLK